MPEVIATDPHEALRQLADAFAKFEDDPNLRIALAAKFFATRSDLLLILFDAAKGLDANAVRVSRRVRTVVEDALANFDSLPDEAYVRVRTVAGVFGCSVPSIWRWAALGTFPKPTRLSARVTAWQVGELRRLLAARRAAA